MRREELLAPMASFRRLSSVVCRLEEVGSRQSAVGSTRTFGDVARSVAFGDKSKKALQSNANQNHSPSTIHHSSKKALHRNAYRNSSFFIPHSSFAQKERPCLSF